MGSTWVMWSGPNLPRWLRAQLLCIFVGVVKIDWGSCSPINLLMVVLAEAPIGKDGGVVTVVGDVITGRQML